jgi:hypothetical protein
MCGFADRGYEEPGRPEGLPHTATIKRSTGAFVRPLLVMGARLLHVSSGLRNPIANCVSDRPTLGSDFDTRNRAVGPHALTVARGLAPVRWRSRRKTGHCGVSEETGSQGLELLRSPTGASPLATNSCFLQDFRISKYWPRLHQTIRRGIFGGEYAVVILCPDSLASGLNVIRQCLSTAFA